MTLALFLVVIIQVPPRGRPTLTRLPTIRNAPKSCRFTRKRTRCEGLCECGWMASTPYTPKSPIPYPPFHGFHLVLILRHVHRVFRDAKCKAKIPPSSSWAWELPASARTDCCPSFGRRQRLSLFLVVVFWRARGFLASCDLVSNSH